MGRGGGEVVVMKESWALNYLREKVGEFVGSGCINGRFKVSTVSVGILVLSSSPYSSAATAFSISYLIFMPVLIYPNGERQVKLP